MSSLMLRRTFLRIAAASPFAVALSSCVTLRTSGTVLEASLRRLVFAVGPWPEDDLATAEDFFARFFALVKNCKTPTEAAQILNQKIFGILKVRYSTGRRRADQSPSESIETGMASCTGLSILLTDACRAVGVPARVRPDHLTTEAAAASGCPHSR